MDRSDQIDFIRSAVPFFAATLQLDLQPLEIQIGTRETLQDTGCLTTQAAVQLDHHYGKHKLWISDDYDSPEELFSDMLHEFIHIKLAPLDQLAETVRIMVGSKKRRLFDHLFTTADEQMTTSLQNLLHPTLWRAFCVHHGIEQDGDAGASGVFEA